jgi:hypothetical protein
MYLLKNTLRGNHEFLNGGSQDIHDHWKIKRYQRAEFPEMQAAP